jgi:hypothetical protein
MSGFGGNRVILNPNGIITFQFTDAHIYGFESMVRVADGMDPFLVHHRDGPAYCATTRSGTHPGIQHKQENAG